MKKNLKTFLSRMLFCVIVANAAFSNTVLAATIAAKSAIGNPSDLFQVLAQPSITADTGVMNPLGYYIEDLFSVYAPTGREDVVFLDANGSNISSIDFHLQDPVNLTQLVVGLANDHVTGPDNDNRTCSNIKVYASLSLGTLMDEVVADIAIDPEYTDAYGGSQIVVDIPLDVEARYFHLEFLEPRNSGVRVFEIDGYGDVLYSDPTLPATILSCSSLPGNVVKMVVDAPSSLDRYYLKSTTDLPAGPVFWKRAAHSDDGVNAFVTTNVSYSTVEIATGTNRVIYAQANHSSEFLNIFGNGERSGTISRELEDYFDQTSPPYNSVERRNALYQIDALVNHHSLPYDDWLRDFFLSRYRKAIDGIKNTDVQTGAVIWNVYNMAYVVKTPEITVAFDLTRLAPALRDESYPEQYEMLAKEIVDLCDILFVSHIHSDHADAFVAGEFISQGKPVLAPSSVFFNENFYNDVTHLPRNGQIANLYISGMWIPVRTYPGHQAVTSTTAVENNVTVVTLPNGITVAHSGDQSWQADFSWIDTVHNDVSIDVFMVNTWTLDPDRLHAGLLPSITLLGHINEMGHGIGIEGGRIPFWKSYFFWETVGSTAIHPFWGEPYYYSN